MSSQRGNVSRTRPQKHKNTFAFKSDKLHSSGATATVAKVQTDALHVCPRCKDIISWKIKYNKYKILKQPKTCSACKKRNVKQNYHSICTDCAENQKKCAKCLESYEDALHVQMQMPNQLEQAHQHVECIKSELCRLLTDLEPGFKDKSLELASKNQMQTQTHTDDLFQLVQNVKNIELKQVSSVTYEDGDQRSTDVRQENDTSSLGPNLT